MSLVLVAASVAGCGPKEPADAKQGAASKSAGTPESKPVLVELEAVKRGMIEEILERSAPLEAEAQVQVLARTQNPAIELLVEEGDRVEKGQVLLRLENDRQQTDYDQAMSQLAKAQIDFDTLESLHQQSLVSESEYRNGRFTFEQARMQSENARRQLEYTEVRAPIGGTVTLRTVKVGDSVGTGTPIFEIIDLDSTVAVIHVPEQYLPKLKPDMEARLISGTLAGQEFPALVKRISPIVDARAGTIKVVVGPRELGALRPGMWVDVELVLDSKDDALLIPKRSIVYENDQTFAFKAYTDTNGVRRAKRERVVARNADKDHIEPVSGFEAGDLIVVAGQSGLKDDSPIRELGGPGTAETPPPTASIAKTETNSPPATTKLAAEGVN
ncbi:MAG TPA: efflux RND transporter periplasmic adaptor subunit [Verrucomicrobiales bacterium]|nr:efflux RND transporter periplasmic adaptor subunit [Verrucomicrobiales bacterium]